MSTTATAALTLTGVCAFNYSGVAASSASWGTWNDTSNVRLGFAGQKATTTIRYAFVYAFTTPSWSGDIDSITMRVQLLEELGNSRTVRWSLTKTNPTGDTTSYTAQDLPVDSYRVDDGTITVTASTEAWYTITVSLASLDQNTTYYLVLSPYTTASGSSNYCTVNMQSSWADVFTGYVTYEMEASDVSAPDGYFGSAMTVSMTDDGLSKTLTYSCAGQTGTIGTTTAASISWTPPSSLMNYVTSDTSATCTITCTTAAGTSTCTCTLSVPASVKPYINQTTTALSTYNSNSTVNSWGICLQNYSQLQLVIAARGTYSATITAWKFTSDAVTMEGTNSSTSLSTTVLSAIITVAGTFTGTLTVTDSRGRTTTLGLGSFTVTAYTAPSISNDNVFRCDSTGTADSEGEYIYAIATQVYSAVGSNTCSLSYRWKARSSSTWTTGSLTSGTGSIIGDGSTVVFSELTVYNFQIIVTDSLTQTTYDYTITSTSVIFNIKPTTTGGAAFGGYAQDQEVLELFSPWILRLPSSAALVVYENNVQTTLAQLIAAGGGSGGTTDYTQLNNKPSINGFTLTGAVTLANIGLVTSIDANSTDLQFPSAKCMYDLLGDVETLLAAI